MSFTVMSGVKLHWQTCRLGLQLLRSSLHLQKYTLQTSSDRPSFPLNSGNEHQDHYKENTNTTVTQLCERTLNDDLELFYKNAKDDNNLSLSFILEYLENDHLFFNSFINQHIGSYPLDKRKKLLENFYKLYTKDLLGASQPLIVNKERKSTSLEKVITDPVLKNSPTTGKNFPFSQYFNVTASVTIKGEDEGDETPDIDTFTDMQIRLQDYKEGSLQPISLKTKPESHIKTEVRTALSTERVVRAIANSDYYTDPSQEEHEFWRNLGTVDRSIPQTSVPCGGCGALFHCHDPSIPGKSRENYFLSCLA